MTATAPARRGSPVLWMGILVIALGIAAVAFFGQDENQVGGRADPNGFGRQGLAALLVMIEESGGTLDRDESFPNEDHEVAILTGRSYEAAVAFGADEDGVFGPIIDWVEAGGTLVAGSDVPGGPTVANVVDTKEIDRGECSIGELQALTSVVVADNYTPIEISSDDQSCFGDREQAVVVSRNIGDGKIVRVASFEPFFNQVLDEGDNGALAATVIGMGAGQSVAVLTRPPAAAGFAGPVDDDGNPLGAGDSSLFDLIPIRVLAMLLGLSLAGLLYAIARGRRLGSPVEEALPIELPSSSYTEAVGRLYSRVEAPRARSAHILRQDFRHTAARRVGLAPDSPTVELAQALSLTTGVNADDLVRLLDGPAPSSDAELVAIATALADHRTNLRFGVSPVHERTSNV